jgi:hypothetical protein
VGIKPSGFRRAENARCNGGGVFYHPTSKSALSFNTFVREPAAATPQFSSKTTEFEGLFMKY